MNTMTAVIIPADPRDPPREIVLPPESKCTEYLRTLQRAVSIPTPSDTYIEATHRWFPYTVEDPFWRNYALYVNDHSQLENLPHNDRLLGFGIYGTAVFIAEDNVCQQRRPWPEAYEPLAPVTAANYEQILRDMCARCCD